jgi:pimeloyl-ACP methyl ester carboxylesterase
MRRTTIHRQEDTMTRTGTSRRELLATSLAIAGGAALSRTTLAQAAATTDGVADPSAAARPYGPWPDADRFSTAFYRLVGEGAAGGSDFQEAFFAAQRIGPRPTADAWTREFAALGRSLLDQARDQREHDPLLARATALRGQNYLRSAEYFIAPQGVSLSRKVAMYREVRAGFALAAVGPDAHPRVVPVRVPYGRHRLYGYFVHPVTRAPGKKVPAVLLYGGIDTLGEQMLLKAGLRFAERGFATLILDGPGMGDTLRLLGLPSRYDYEHATAAAFDWLQTVPWVNPRRIAIVGESLGGYYAARSAAFEHRARTCVVWGGLYSFSSTARAGTGSTTDPEAQRALGQQLLWVIGGNDSDRLTKQFPKFDLTGIVHRIKCPTLVIHGADDDTVALSDGQRIHRELRVHKKLHVVPSGTPGATHCQADSLPAAWAPMLPWLDEQLAA